MIDDVVFYKGIDHLGRLFGAIKPDSIDIYKRYLNDLSNEEFIESAQRMIKDRRYKDFPTVADILYYAGRDIESIAKDAIEKLKRAVKKFSDYESISFSDGTLNAVISNFAKWQDIRSWSNEDWNYNYKRLVDLYSAYKRNGTTEDRVKGVDEQRGHKYRIRRIQEIGQKPILSEIQIPLHKSALLRLEDNEDMTIDFSEIYKILNEGD